MDGLMDELMDGWMDGWMDGRTNGWMDGITIRLFWVTKYNIVGLTNGCG